MDTARCRAFVAAAENGSFTKAAEILNYTTSGISQLVTTLGSDLDLILLERTRKGVRLTDAGIIPVESGHFALENCCEEIAGYIRDMF